MKIGDEVYIHGYIDEIRKDTVIIRNDGGYFGTVESEIKARPKGKWIKYEGFQGGIKEEWYQCPECGWRNALSIPRNFCPNCGAVVFEDRKRG